MKAAATLAREGRASDAAVGVVATALAARKGRAVLTLLGLGGLFIVCVLASVGIGMVSITPGQLLAILARRSGLTLPWPYAAQQETVLLAIRLPRVLLAGLIGAGLATAGAAMQGLFRNPLADPGLVGVSSGAALAVVSIIVLGATVFSGVTRLLGPFTLPVAAFGGGVVTHRRELKVL